MDVAFAETALGRLSMKIVVLSEGGRIAAGSSPYMEGSLVRFAWGF
jgi:hypothetical protein